MKYNFLRYPEGKIKAVTFSYDDGTVHDKRLSDTITPYGIKCTFNLCGGGWDKEDAEEYMLGRGHEIAIHGWSHRGMDTLRPTEMIQEVLNCKTALEEKYGRFIRGYAYPDRAIRRDAHPDMYARVRNVFEELDIAYCRTLGAANEGFFLPQDFYNWLGNAMCFIFDCMNFKSLSIIQ
jgi:peptidoglycan/xylan/chitin deacetylase (PgdA/CDA1 family)